MNFDILYEDDDCLFINKPAGISVHSDGKTQEVTLADILLAKYPHIEEVSEPIKIEKAGGKIEHIKKPGIVHRLDKDTSGVMVVAKNAEAYLFFKKQFQEHSVEKKYHAFVYGWIKEDNFLVNDPIGRDSGNIRKWTTGKNARGTMREAVTNFKVLSRFGNIPYVGKGSTENGTFSFIEAIPQTGRTHQIRVHLKSINHPIVSDSLYASSRNKALGFDRQALHAYSLAIDIPSKKRINIIAPYPSDFEDALKNIELHRFD